MTRVTTARYSFFIVFILLLAFPAAGQTTFGSITGTVTDPSGGVIPNAKVTVTNEGTQTQQEVSTGGTGAFNVPNLDVGTYEIQVEAEGFALYERTGLIINANQVLNVDATLSLAATAVVTEVRATIGEIDTETNALRSVKTSRDLQNLPVISRQRGDSGYFTFVLLNTGFVSSPRGSIVVQGVRRRSGTSPTMDGIRVMQYPIGAGPEAPGVDAIQQVNIQLGNAQAEFPTVAQYTVISKGGTNEFHGSAYWDYNGNSLNARDFFATSTPFRVYHNYSFSAAGPIQKNKTFFFGNYERGKESAHKLIVQDLPLPAWHDGDFSGLSKTITDPLTGQPFPGNQIPSDRISQVSRDLQEFVYPPPNFGPPGLLSSNYRAQFPGYTGHTNYYHFSIRADHNFRDSDRVFGRVSYRRMPKRNVFGLPKIATEVQVYQGRSAVLSWTHLFGPTLLNEFRAGASHIENWYESTLVGRDFLDQFGIQGVNITEPIHGVPIFSINGVSNIQGSGEHNDNIGTSYQWTDNLSWTRGSHFLKFGLDVIRDGYDGEYWPPDIFGRYNFSGVYTGLGYADFLLGIPQTTQLRVPDPKRTFRGNLWGMYAQDQFKVNRKLTLNFGVRWQVNTPYHHKIGAMYTFDPASGALVVPDKGIDRINPFFPQNIPIIPASQAGLPSDSLIDTDWNNIQPRVGFAYKPFAGGRSVIRGGYGIYGNTVFGMLARSHMGGGPFSGRVTYVNSLVNGVPLFSFPRPFLEAGTTGTQDVTGVNPRLHMPYTQQWNLTVEHEVSGVGLRATYLGTHSLNLIYRRNLNQPAPSTTPFSKDRRFYPIFNDITYADNGGNEQYHALELAATKTSGKNLTFSAGWTYGKDIADTPYGNPFSGPVIQNQFDRRAEKADGNLAITHRVFAYMVYALPFGRGQRFLSNAHPVLQGLLGGWDTAWNMVIQSGNFFTPSFSGLDPSNTNSFGGRPDRIGDGNLSSGRSIDRWFDASAFKVPGCPDETPACSNPANIGRFGNSGNNILRGPRIVGFDFSLMKYFPIHERLRLQFRVTMNNAFNHPNFSLPRSNISSSSTIGTINRTTRIMFGQPAPREIHLSARLEF